VNLESKLTVLLRVVRSRLVRFTGLALVGLVLLGWTLWLRPEFAGGRTGYAIVTGHSMLPALHAGDLAMVQRQPVYRVGDVVAYRIPDGVFRGRRIIHRIVGGDPAGGFAMRGDNNADDDLWRPRPSDIEGRFWKRLPGAGRLVAFARAPAVLAAVVGGFVFAFVMTWKPRPEAVPRPRPGGAHAVAAADHAGDRGVEPRGTE
jgi:signal peptidase